MLGLIISVSLLELVVGIRDAYGTKRLGTKRLRYELYDSPGVISTTVN